MAVFFVAESVLLVIHDMFCNTVFRAKNEILSGFREIGIVLLVIRQFLKNGFNTNCDKGFPLYSEYVFA